MSNTNLEVLLEKSNQVSLGLRARQSGITLKEYFLTQQKRAKNILASQKIKLNEAIVKASKLSKDSSNKSSSNISITITNKAGKNEKKVLSTSGSTYPRIFNNLKKISTEIYSILKYRASQIIKYSNDGIKKASQIIKGKASKEQYEEAKENKKYVSEYVSLLNSSLLELRELFKSFREALR